MDPISQGYHLGRLGNNWIKVYFFARGWWSLLYGALNITGYALGARRSHFANGSGSYTEDTGEVLLRSVASNDGFCLVLSPGTYYSLPVVDIKTTSTDGHLVPCIVSSIVFRCRYMLVSFSYSWTIKWAPRMDDHRWRTLWWIPYYFCAWYSALLISLHSFRCGHLLVAICISGPRILCIHYTW